MPFLELLQPIMLVNKNVHNDFDNNNLFKNLLKKLMHYFKIKNK